MLVTITGYKNKDSLRMSKKTVEIPDEYRVNIIRKNAMNTAKFETANLIEFVCPWTGKSFKYDAMNGSV